MPSPNHAFLIRAFPQIYQPPATLTTKATARAQHRSERAASEVARLSLQERKGDWASRPNPCMSWLRGEGFTAGLRPAFAPRAAAGAATGAPNLRAALLRVALGGSNPPRA